MFKKPIAGFIEDAVYNIPKLKSEDFYNFDLNIFSILLVIYETTYARGRLYGWVDVRATKVHKNLFESHIKTLIEKGYLKKYDFEKNYVSVYDVSKTGVLIRPDFFPKLKELLKIDKELALGFFLAFYSIGVKESYSFDMSKNFSAKWKTSKYDAFKEVCLKPRITFDKKGVKIGIITYENIIAGLGNLLLQPESVLNEIKAWNPYAEVPLKDVEIDEEKAKEEFKAKFTHLPDHLRESAWRALKRQKQEEKLKKNAEAMETKNEVLNDNSNNIISVNDGKKNDVDEFKRIINEKIQKLKEKKENSEVKKDENVDLVNEIQKVFLGTEVKNPKIDIRETDAFFELKEKVNKLEENFYSMNELLNDVLQKLHQLSNENKELKEKIKKLEDKISGGNVDLVSPVGNAVNDNFVHRDDRDDGLLSEINNAVTGEEFSYLRDDNFSPTDDKQVVEKFKIKTMNDLFEFYNKVKDDRENLLTLYWKALEAVKDLPVVNELRKIYYKANALYANLYNLAFYTKREEIPFFKEPILNAI